LTFRLDASERALLEAVTVERIERYLADKRKAGLAPATLHRHLATLSLIFGAAKRRRLVRENPVPDVERPRAQRRRWRIISPTELGATERAFAELAAEAPFQLTREAGRIVNVQAADIETARLLFVVMMGAGLRRGEALGLRWRSVVLADPDRPVLRVDET
jgi:site-specific recombinase XerD